MSTDNEERIKQQARDIFVLIRVMLSHIDWTLYFAKNKHVQDIVARNAHLFLGPKLDQPLNDPELTALAKEIIAELKEARKQHEQ